MCVCLFFFVNDYVGNTITDIKTERAKLIFSLSANDKCERSRNKTFNTQTIKIDDKLFNVFFTIVAFYFPIKE